MPDTNSVVFAYPILLEPDEDGRLVATSVDFPELATDGADIGEALANASDALDLVIRERLRQGEPVPDPSPRRTPGYVACPEHVTAYRVALSRWALGRGRGAQKELAQLLNKGETHVRRLLSPEGGASMKSLVGALAAIGFRAEPTLALTLHGRMLGAPGTPRPKQAPVVSNRQKPAA
ncbi:type II toxin-antitoxin system HicB family antitoxin [Maricaulis sp.]|uniref:type II toxin-antitoxin system HicB family antitoxin n=1 Tax=Maricaulis sp. TaxID=1486257 RepID=UPI003A938A15